MNKAIPAIGLILAIIVSGCSTPGGKPSTSTSTSGKSGAPAATAVTPPRPEPDWVNGDSANYGRIEYITMKSSADTAEQARQQARDKIIALFTYLDVDTGDNSNSATQSSNLAAAAAPEIASETKIVDEWQNPTTKTYYAFAALLRKHGESYMNNTIPQLDQQTSQLMETMAKKDADPLRKIGLLAKAVRAQQQRQHLQKSMRVVDLTGRGIKPVWDIVRLQADLEEQLKQLKIRPSGLSESTDEAAAMTAMLSGGLKTAGLIPTDASHADYLLKGKLTITPKRLPNNWVSGEGVLHIELAENVAGLNRGEKTWNIEQPGLDEDVATRRVNEKAEFLLKKEMRNVLLEIARKQP